MMCVYIYICVYVIMCMYIYIYIYMLHSLTLLPFLLFWGGRRPSSMRPHVSSQFFNKVLGSALNNKHANDTPNK